MNTVSSGEALPANALLNETLPVTAAAGWLQQDWAAVAFAGSFVKR